MIGRGFVTFLDNAGVLQVSKHVRRDLERSRRRGDLYAVHPDVRDLIDIADAIIAKSIDGLGLERSGPVDAGSAQSSDDDLLIISEVVAEGLLPWGDHEIRRKIRLGELPAARSKPPYLLRRGDLLAITASLDQGAA
jgi:hypothetical protein